MPRVVPAYTLQDVTINEIQGVNVHRSPSNILATFRYDLKDENGDVRDEGSYEIVLSGSALSTFSDWVSTHLPDINVAEGM